MLGGNLRQAGIVCRAGLENLENWEETFTQDHDNCLHLATSLSSLPCLSIDTSTIETNIFRFKFQPDYTKFTHSEFNAHMREKCGIKMVHGHKNEALRIVTHRDVSKKDIETAISAFRKELGE